MGATRRIRQYLEYKGISRYRFAKDLGFSNKFLDNSENMGTDNACKILHHYDDINPGWLLTGNGKMLIENNSDILYEPTATYQSNKGIPLYDTIAAAGYGTFEDMISREKVIGKFVVPTFSAAQWMIYVRGSSMYPKYSSGDIIACKEIKDSGFIQWNKVYVIATREQGLLVKRLMPSDNDSCIKAISDNKDYPPFDIPKDEIHGIALVLGVIRLE